MRIFLVGGAVRDRLLGLTSKDNDYAVEASGWEEMRAWVHANSLQVFLETPEFLTIRALDKNKQAVDYVLCRKDGAYSDGRRPDNVEMGTIMDDLRRRDFTMNAMAIDIETGELLDPFGGQRDLEEKIIRCVGNPVDRFNEDALRIIRALRFHITKGMELHHSIWLQLLFENGWSSKLLSVSTDRRREELTKCFKHDTFKTMEMLHKLPIKTQKAMFEGIWLLPTSKEK